MNIEHITEGLKLGLPYIYYYIYDGLIFTLDYNGRLSLKENNVYKLYGINNLPKHVETLNKVKITGVVTVNKKTFNEKFSHIFKTVKEYVEFLFSLEIDDFLERSDVLEFKAFDYYNEATGIIRKSNQFLLLKSFNFSTVFYDYLNDNSIFSLDKINYNVNKIILQADCLKEENFIKQIDLTGE